MATITTTHLPSTSAATCNGYHQNEESISALYNETSAEDTDSEDDLNASEALNVLLQLDQLLNDCLIEIEDDSAEINEYQTLTEDATSDSNEVSQTFSDDFVLRDSEESSLQLSVEECLNDLDAFLTSIEDSCSTSSRTQSVICDLSREDLCAALLSVRARAQRQRAQLTRSMSDCRSRSMELIRSHAFRTTIGAIKSAVGKQHKANECDTVTHLTPAPGGCDDPSVASTPGEERTSGHSPPSDDFIIPWCWLEGQTRASSTVDIDGGMVTRATPPTPQERRHTWVRTSMRRLQPVQLPEEVPVPQSVEHVTGSERMSPPDATMLLPLNFANGYPPEGLVHAMNATASNTTTTRPISAPSRIVVTRNRSRSRERNVDRERARSSSASSRSRRARSLSSVSSLPSSIESSPSCTPIPTISNGVSNGTRTASYDQTNVENGGPNRTCERTSRSDMPEAESPLGQWPHSMSSTLAYIGCTLGIFNISRFAILSVHFGANFIFQFLIVSFGIGIPLFTLYQCLGQQLGAGVIDMWRISPMFQGVGVSLLFFQMLTGLYSIVGISWMFVYFRDAFVTKFERYRWSEPFLSYRNEIQPPINGSYKLSETVPDYLSGVVLQRHHLVSDNAYGTIKFQPAFNLAVVWMIVFVSLSKGLRSYGKVIYVFTILPIFGLMILCTKLLGLMPAEVNGVFPETSWNEFFINSRSWMAACQEAFLTWGMLGAAIMQIASHNKNKKLLQRDSSLITFITITVLILAAFLANTCLHILKAHGYSYHPDSFEKITTYTFLRHVSDPLPQSVASTPVKYMQHHSFIVGDRVSRPGIDPSTESGYQVLRFATELIPTTFSILGTEKVSPFWTVLFYFVLILFGIAQQLAIWHCVITGIMAIKAKVLKSWETTITFFSCACGFLLGLPMTTEYGIYVVYFLDVAVGGIWWLIVVILLQIIAVFMVRGRPYSGDMLVTALFRKTTQSQCFSVWIPVILSFIWNVVLPVVLMVWCITFFKNGNFRELFIWHHGIAIEYWPLWVRQVGSLLQLLPVLGVPFIAVVQSYRYLNNGPNDILEEYDQGDYRIQLLYRPPLGEHMDDIAIQEAAAASLNNNTTTTTVSEDPPPKYTPPPSYTTATGARIAKLLRQSFRRSVRRIANVLGEASGTRNGQRTTNESAAQPPPPDYNDVLVEMHQNRDTVVNVQETRNNMIQRELATIATSSTGLTAADVACILRSSFRRSTVRTMRRNNQPDTTMSSLSAENLVDSAAPIGETSLVLNLNSSNDKDDTTVI